MIEWEEVPEAAAALSALLMGPAGALQKQAGAAFTVGDVGYFMHPESGLVGLCGRGATIDDLRLCKEAAARAVGADSVIPIPLGAAELADDLWVKVAHSPTLRRVGEYLNFFPGTLPGGIPNMPSPLAAMLTTALVGGGLGYGGGKILGAVLPEKFGKKLPSTGAAAGIAAGSLLAAPWVAANAMQGKSVTDGSLLAPREDDVRELEGDVYSGDRGEDAGAILKKLREYDPLYVRRQGLPALKSGAAVRTLDDVELAPRVYGLLLKQADLFGQAVPRGPATMSDVNVNALGQTLWESGASPRLTAATLGSVYAASQFPDPNARPGWVTGHQLGSLAANAASDYVKGLAVGAVLNATVGTPWRAPAFGAGAAALGVIGAVLPRLFG